MSSSWYDQGSIFGLFPSVVKPYWSGSTTNLYDECCEKLNSLFIKHSIGQLSGIIFGEAGRILIINNPDKTFISIWVHAKDDQHFISSTISQSESDFDLECQINNEYQSWALFDASLDLDNEGPTSEISLPLGPLLFQSKFSKKESFSAIIYKVTRT